MNSNDDRMEQMLPAIRALQKRAADLEERQSEPIAIVSMACRLPGGIASPEEFWALLDEGGDAIGEFPPRWDGLDLYDPDPTAVGKSYAREGGFLRDVDRFDAGFFGISPREAQSMDPQQRVVLETAWEALERAGVRPESLYESKTGVYLGTMSSDYGNQQGFDLDALDGYLSTGNASSAVSGRVSYALGLQGPAVTVDTACSSSLVSLHLACAALRQRECDLALAGGVTVMSTPALFVEFSRLKAISADGRCRSFAADADGTGPAEGCGVVVLKRLSRARQDGDRVLAVIRGSAVNQDGRSQGLTAPNGPAQQRVVREALAAARLAPGDIDAVEAHGTGTSLGDPIEAGALGEVFGERDRPLWLGSAKSNIGHTQAAAGIAGLIKMVLALEHERLPRSRYAERPSEHIDWGGAVALLADARPWPRGERVRRAGVSSFGLSGTNAHVVVEEPPAVAAAEDTVQDFGPALPIVVSGRDRAAMADNASRLADWLVRNGEGSLADVALSAGERTQFACRGAAVAVDLADAVKGLQALAAGESRLGVVSGEARSGGLAMLFTGQGAQHPAMGAGLRAFPVFREAFDAASGAAGDVSRTEFAQPALFAFEVALFRLWESWGVRPSVVAGHSIGELAAAHVAGVLSLDDAVRLVVARGRLMQACRTDGAMVSIEAAESEITLTEGVSVAGLNGPRQTVISGDEAAVLAIAESFRARGRRTRRLDVSHAFHSGHMDAMLDEFADVVASCTFSAPEITVVSTLTGEVVTDFGGDYWVRQARGAVRFLDAMSTLDSMGVAHYVECGPGGVLSAMGAACLPEDTTATFLPSTRPDADEMLTVLSALAGLHTAGHAIDWDTYLAGTGARRVVLPTYAFQRDRYWLTVGRSAGDLRSAGLESLPHPWLRAVTTTADGEGYLLTGRLSLTEQPWLADHTVFDAVVVPGTSILELVLNAAHQVGAVGIGDLTLGHPLVLPDEGCVRLQITVGPLEVDGRRPVAVYSQLEDTHGAWTQHATGELIDDPVADGGDGFAELADWPVTDATPLDPADLYETFDHLGIVYGPAFQGLVDVSVRGRVAYGRADLPPAAPQTTDYEVHPALLDAALHTIAALEPEETGADSVLLPFHWGGVELYSTASTSLRVRVELDATRTSARVWVADENGYPVAYVDELRLRAADAAQLRGTDPVEHLYRVEFQPLRATGRELPELTVLGDGVAAELLGVPVLPLTADPAGLTGSVVVDLTAVAGEVEPDTVPADAAGATVATLALVQRLLAAPGDAELVFLTRHAVCATAEEDIEGLACSPAWGLVRSARAEYPDRVLRLVDAGADTAPTALAAALAASDEPELAVIGTEVAVPRLAPVLADERESGPVLDADGTVLVTGGAGELGGLLARHLVEQHGVRHLLLTSRRGLGAPGAEELVDELREAGADTVTVVAADVTDREQVTAVVSEVDIAHPLTAVFHLAGVLDDGLLAGQDAGRFERVLAPKVAGAWHLHEATRGRDLAAFVLFSSVSGVLGSAGQSNYAAANTFLDALAAHRRANGLVATSLAWGLWEQAGTGMTAHLGEAELARLRREGVAPLTAAEGLRAFDLALAQHDPHLVPIRLDPASLWLAAEKGGEVPALLREIVRGPRRRPATGSTPTTLRDRLTALTEQGRRDTVTQLVRREAAVVLGSTVDAIGARQTLSEIGMDSLMAVELRKRLAAETDVALPATLAFDYPTAEAIAGLVLDRLALGAPVSRPVPVAREKAPTDDAIAIVSMACRLPGGVASPEEFWALLAEGGDAVGGFPERWRALDLFDPDPDAVGKSYAREGGFLSDVERFDAGFFGISPREALAMDPQQRIVLETAWEALERAGIRPETLVESNTGVYLGAMSSDYDTQQRGGLAGLDGYMSTGNASSVVSGRVSYALGLQGPAVTVDTACSSSLVALHLANTALRHGETDLAIVGGVTVMSTPAAFVEFSRLKGLAPDGRCKSFSASADGVGWAEGCGIVVLKRLADAERDGDRVLAVVRASAINQDGRSQGLTAPNGPSQQRVIRDALAAAGLTPGDIDAIEAHGTGTTLGDPIEAGALAEVFGPGRDATRPVWLGSSKSNIGHTQAAAGVTGLIKMVLALGNETLPPTIHADRPSDHIAWDGSGLALTTTAQRWARGERPRRAGISSFGFSGTNAHVVIEEPAAVDPAAAPAPATCPVPVSGVDHAALRDQALRWAEWLADHPDTPLADVARTAALHRTHFDTRAGVTAATTADAAEALRALANGVPRTDVTEGTAEPRGTVVFVFPGQGSQWLGMGRQLLAESPAFAQAVAACDDALRPHTGWSVREVLADDNDLDFDRVDVVQPALWTMYVALAAAWRSLGLEPDAVVGHSQGEVAAAVVAGALTVEQGALVVAMRSRAVRDLSRPGAMALVGRPVAEVEARIAEYGDALSVAVVNTPTSTVVSGDVDAVDELVATLGAEDVYARKVKVDYASHSAHMDELLPVLAAELTGLRPRPTRIPFYSTVSGTILDGERLDGGYWARNLREPVRLDRAQAALLDDGHDVFVELSPHPVLVMPLTDGCAGRGGVVVGTLQRDHGGLGQLVGSLNTLHANGVDVDWTRVLPAGPAADLPTYAFQRERYWAEPRTGGDGDAGSLGLVAATHPWLGAATAVAGGDSVLLTGRLSLAEQPWLADHTVFGTTLLPGTGLLELALAAADQVGAVGVGELTLTAPLVLPETGHLRIQVVIGAPTDGRRPVAMYSQPETVDQGAWTRHATGDLVDDPAGADTLTAWPPPGAERVDITGFYASLAEQGLGYGPAFRGVTELWRDGDTGYGVVSLPDGVDPGAFRIHPALLDAALHTLVGTRPADTPEGTALLPFEWAGVRLYATGSTSLRVRVTLDTTDPAAPVASVLVADPTGRPVLAARELRVRTATVDQLTAARADHLYRVEFQPVAVPEVVAPAERVVVTPATAAEALTELHRLLDDPAELVFRTEGAVAARPDDAVDRLAAAGVWGLVRSARNERPEKVIRLVDTDGSVDLDTVLSIVDEPELAVRHGAVLAPRLVRATAADGVLAPRVGDAWQLDITEKGRLDTITVAPIEHTEPLADNEVLVGIRAAGLNFRDVLNALGMVYAPKLGLECAGVVLAAGSAVTNVRVGDRVMGLATGTFGTEVRVDARLMTPIPDSVTFAEAATVPLTFLTAWYGLDDIGGLRAGERLLVHAAAGGVGMAAVQLAHHWGATVYGTASAAKWPMVHDLGVPAERVASSRDLGFATEWSTVDFDVVLNSLSGEYVDASLRLLGEGGRFVEMGKTDIRDAAAYPDVRYTAFDLQDSTAERIQEMLVELGTLLAAGSITPLPYQAYDVREAQAAFRHMQQARHVGKLVLTTPRPLDPAGAVLLTGGTGELGRQVAERLVTHHGARHLVLASRRGSCDADLVADLHASGAETVEVVACDVADRAAVAAMLDSLTRPLTAVVHLAAVLDDGALDNQTPARLAAVWAPKADGARHLDELTADRDLAAFVLFSSAAGTLGAPGQANYAAANAYLDALAARRRKRGLPAVSLAWGLWEQAGVGMTAHLGEADLARLRRNRAGALPVAEALDLLDAALNRPETHLVPQKLDLTPGDADPPALFRTLVRPRLRQASAAADPAGSLADRLAVLPPAERLDAMMSVVRREVAGVLGLAGENAVRPDQVLKTLGIDSLTAVELRNRMARHTGTTLPGTLVFDYPTPHELAEFLLTQLDLTDAPPDDPARAIQWALSRVSPIQLLEQGVVQKLLELAQPQTAPPPAQDALAAARELSLEDMDSTLDSILGDS